MSPVLHDVVDAYDSLAPFYESLTHDFEHSRWLGRLEELARDHGMRGRRVLDVACGTGKSLIPLLDLGYEGVGCDVSSRMLDIARGRLPSTSLAHGDMRDLPELGLFPWVTCINDAINYLLDDADLCRALKSMSRALEPGGVLTFDVNTLTAHRWLFDSTFVVEQPDTYVCWRGLGRADGHGEVGTTEISVFAHTGSAWGRTISRHRQRWWSDEEVEEAAETAGLRIVGRYGQRHGAVLEDGYDERCHTKLVYFLKPVRDGSG